MIAMPNPVNEPQVTYRWGALTPCTPSEQAEADAAPYAPGQLELARAAGLDLPNPTCACSTNSHPPEEAVERLLPLASSNCSPPQHRGN